MSTEASKGSLQALFRSYSGSKSIMNTSDVGELVRELGYAPSLRELETFKQRVGASCGIQQVQEFLGTLGHPEDTAETFLKFFKFYDPQNTGRINRATLEKLLSHVGEPLNDEELSTFFKNTCDFGEEVPYEELIKKLLLK